VSSFVVASALTALASAWVPASASTVSTPTGLRDRAHQATSSGGNLIDHGGPILPTSHTYALYWGSPSGWSSDVQSGIASLFGGFNGSNLLGIGHQYMRGAAIASAYEGSKVDISTPPRKVSASNLGTEVAKVYGTSFDPNGIYFVYTSNFPKGGGFCAWHSATTVSGHTIAVAYMPNTTGVAGCDPGNTYGLSGSEGLRSLANVTSHEFMEAVTDTQISAWKDSSGSEIGDKCAWQFTGPVKLSNGTVWQLQEEWSNAISGCAQGQ
jgi:hypothetical protein